MKTNIKEVKKGQLIRFGDHEHDVLGDLFDCSGFLGEVVELHNHVEDEWGNVDLEINVQLKSNTYANALHEWDNCLIFRFPDDECYDDVEVTIINAKGENDA